MDLLVLDTIHGGREIGNALTAAGHHVDMVDVYHGPGTTGASVSSDNFYEKIIVPVHLNPDHPLLHKFPGTPQITHHEAVKWIIGDRLPVPMVEITGTRGKTTTANAIAHILPGPGILHTSGGTYRFPERETLFRRSITPASVIAATKAAIECGGWLVAEESLGVTGAGDLAVITSGEDYQVAAGKKSALAIKLRSSSQSRHLLVAPGIHAPHAGTVQADDVARINGVHCDYNYHGISGSFENPLLDLAAYRTPLMIAAAAGCMLGIDPAPLHEFKALAGRMAVSRENGHVIIDNANSGVTRDTAIEAARYARLVSGEKNLILVIGQESHAVCEGFPPDEVLRTIDSVLPSRVVIVGNQYSNEYMVSSLTRYSQANNITYTGSLVEGKTIALATPDKACVVLAVKSWR